MDGHQPTKVGHTGTVGVEVTRRSERVADGGVRDVRSLWRIVHGRLIA